MLDENIEHGNDVKCVITSVVKVTFAHTCSPIFVKRGNKADRLYHYITMKK